MSLHEKARQFRKATQLALRENVTDLSNMDILSMSSIYDLWSPNGVVYEKDTIVRVAESDEEVLYKCVTTHTSQENWKPSQSTASIWERIDTEHTGTKDDPIPAARNMMYYKDKYYVEGSTVYRCTRNSEIALHYVPSELIGQYFEVAV